MSCIRFNTPQQRKAMRDAAPSMLTPEEAASLYPAPPITDSKLARMRALAESENPKIRERAALDYHLDDATRRRLAADSEDSVRACLARNATTSCDILRVLASDESPTVRGFVALNWWVPQDVMEQLSDDSDSTVRALVAWKASLREGQDNG